MTAVAKISEAPVRLGRDDWLSVALKTLVSDGIEHVKIKKLAENLKTSRSSFYWFFEDRSDLLAALLDLWKSRNTGAILDRANAPSTSIAASVLAVFECWVDDTLFDARLDFAIREWARRDGDVLRAIEAADQERIAALSAMFRRHGYGARESLVRARILYFTQIGYYALVPDENLDARRRNVDAYILGFTGQAPTRDERAGFDRFLAALENRRPPE